MSNCKNCDCGNSECGEKQSVTLPLPWTRVSRAAPLTHLFHEECAWLYSQGVDTNNEVIRNILQKVYMSAAYTALTTVINGLEGVTPKGKEFRLSVSMDELIEEAARFVDTCGHLDTEASEVFRMTDKVPVSPAEEEDDMEEAAEEEIEDVQLFTIAGKALNKKYRRKSSQGK